MRVESDRFLTRSPSPWRPTPPPRTSPARPGTGPRAAHRALALTRDARVHADRDRHVRLLAQGAAVRRAARRRTLDIVGAMLWRATQLIDSFGLFTSEAYLRSREEVIRRQQDELIELSTPVVKLWKGVVALPLIGTLDSARTQVVMESLLREDRRDRLGDRDHRHHRRPDGRHAGRPAPAQDRHRRPADGRRLHHQRHPAADRADDRAPRPGPLRGRRRSPASPTRSTVALERTGFEIVRRRTPAAASE